MARGVSKWQLRPHGGQCSEGAVPGIEAGGVNREPLRRQQAMAERSGVSVCGAQESNAIFCALFFEECYPS